MGYEEIIGPSGRTMTVLFWCLATRKGKPGLWSWDIAAVWIGNARKMAPGPFAGPGLPGRKLSAKPAKPGGLGFHRLGIAELSEEPGADGCKRHSAQQQ